MTYDKLRIKKHLLKSDKIYTYFISNRLLKSLTITELIKFDCFTSSQIWCLVPSPVLSLAIASRTITAVET
jgi:hypothetical protein